MVVEFDVLWRYFAWFNQTLGMITLWALSVWLARHQKCYWIALLPAIFMTFIILCYILMAPEGFKLPLNVAVAAGVAMALFLTVLFFRWKSKQILKNQ